MVTNNPFHSQEKMFHHSGKLSLFTATGDVASPILMEINLTNACPLKCKWCISSYSHKKEFIDTDKLLSFLKDYKKANGKAVTWSGGGEPTSHPDFVKIMKETKKIGLDQGLMTNGVYPMKYNKTIANCCTWVRFSVDTSNYYDYAKSKGVNCLHHVIDNIKDIDKTKAKIGINMNLPQEEGFTVSIPQLHHLSAKLGVEYFQIRPVLPRYYEHEKVNLPILKRQIKFLKYIDGHKLGKTKATVSWDKFNDLISPNFGRDYKKCKGHVFECVIDANGDMVSCMYHLKDKKFIFGNIYKETFTQIWQGKKRRNVMNHCNKLDFKNCQVCCKCHEINKLINYIDNNKEDVNFI